MKTLSKSRSGLEVLVLPVLHYKPPIAVLLVSEALGIEVVNDELGNESDVIVSAL